MKAMILAAGRGERLRPLTDSVPKPLIEVAGQRLIERHLIRLERAGIREIVVNVSYLGGLIEAALGDGSDFGVRIAYSREPHGALETAGGIAQALPLLGDQPFALINADIWTDFDFAALDKAVDRAHLIVIANPSFNPNGDFTPAGGKLQRQSQNSHTYSGIGVFTPALFRDLPRRPAPLAPILFALSEQNRLTGTSYTGQWFDIGTLERLTAARLALS